MPQASVSERRRRQKGCGILNGTQKHVLPADIERTSMAIISEELEKQGICLDAQNAAVIKRVIHTTADFDYAKNLRFTPGAVRRGIAALQSGAPIVTDTNMAKAGVSKPGLLRLKSAVHCFMAEEAVAERAKEAGTTRAAAAVDFAAAQFPNAVFAVGNAPTALWPITAQIERGLRPALVIAVPVGFVNVVESKTRLLAVCEAADVPAIVALGRKGGSNVAAAVCNALIYAATNMLDPKARGWQ